MKTLSPPQRNTVVRHYRDLKNLVDQFDQTVLKLMRHPDATAEHLLVAHEKCVRLHKEMHDCRQLMLKAGFHHV